MAKRETGYSVTVRMFIPVNMTDLDDPVTKAQAVRDAVRGNDLAGLAAVGTIEGVAAKFVNRMTEEPLALAGAEPEGEEGSEEVAGETQAESETPSRRARGKAAAE